MEILTKEIIEITDEGLLEWQLSFRPLNEDEILANKLHNIMGEIALESTEEAYFASRPQVGYNTI